MAGISLKAKGILTRIIYLYRRKSFQIKPPFEMRSPKSRDPSVRHLVVYLPGNEATWAIMNLKKWRSRTIRRRNRREQEMQDYVKHIA